MKNKVLIVEDNLINRNILNKILKDEYEIIEAVNGAEALTVIEEEYQSISAVVLDLIMPVMDGRELLTILAESEQYSNLPILIATGENSAELEMQCLELGAWDFIRKPYNPVVLKLRLRNIIGRSQTYLLSQIQLLAERDQLTGMYNRRYFMKRAGEMIRRETKEQFVLIRIDINQFRQYNTSFGSGAGDRLLQVFSDEIEGRLEEIESGHKVYGRIQADVFCVCIPYRKEVLEQAMDMAEQKMERFCVNYRLKVSFGLYVIEDREMDVEKMYANSSEAARHCKESPDRGCYAYYGAEMGSREEHALRVTNELSKAIREKQFKIFLQPKYSVQTNMPCGAEALVRWQHPEWGMVSPGEFIPVFEKNGLITQIDYYMWENTCALLKRWKDEGRELFPVSINISRISMYNPKMVDVLVGMTEKYQVDKQYLNLEITESAYMSNPDLMKNTISRLRQHGFVILMDDFGSGYSSLNTLKDIDVDILKIDMKFLPTGQNNKKGEKILASIIRMAGWLGMPVIVEGVETLEQKEFLESIGCKYIQGYFYARPMPVESYEELLSTQRNEYQSGAGDNAQKIEELDSLWASDSNTGALLKSISVPYVIFEYSDKTFDMLRTNTVYQEVFLNEPLEKYLFEQEYNKLVAALDDVAETQSNCECTSLFIMQDGVSRWYQINLTYISTVDKTSLISATFTDVSAAKRLEMKLNEIFGAMNDRGEHKKNLLVVDDQEVSRRVIRSVLDKTYEVIEAEDGVQGLAILEEKKKKIAAILLDMIMPNMGGQEFLMHKNEMQGAADIPVIVISAEDNPSTQINMLANGVNDYVTKPFVPDVIRKRISNVVEYNDRFRRMVKEYQASKRIGMVEGEGLNLSKYSKVDIRNLLQVLQKVFDLVRLVDPKETTVITFCEDGTIERKPYSCFSIWGRRNRCENCSSMCALHGHCAVNKIELLKEDIFYVVSQPVTLYLDAEEPESIVLEIASIVSENAESVLTEANLNVNMIGDSQGLLYRDPLTDAFNRRFLDEKMFLYHGQNGIAKSIAIIMLDLYKFKQINDLFGHQIGDKVLQDITKSLQTQIRKNDSLIRYGGDEFVIVLTDCKESQIAGSIERFKAAVQEVTYGAGAVHHAEADFGAAFTEAFDTESHMLEEMIKEADTEMYQNKRSRLKQ